MTPEELKALGLLLALVVAVVGGFWALSKHMLKLFETHLDSKFGSLNERLVQIEAGEKANGQAVTQVERDLMALRAELPEKYVRREDYVRGQTVIESKLDALAVRLEKVQLRELR